MADANQNPEQLARDEIDTQLRASGWTIQNKGEWNHNEGLGQAVLKHAFSGQLVPQDPSDEPVTGIRAEREAETRQEGR